MPVLTRLPCRGKRTALLRALVRSIPRATATLLQKQDQRTRCVMRAHCALSETFDPARLRAIRARKVDAGSDLALRFGAPHVRMTACTMHCFGPPYGSVAPPPVSFKVAQ